MQKVGHASVCMRSSKRNKTSYVMSVPNTLHMQRANLPFSRRPDIRFLLEMNWLCDGAHAEKKPEQDKLYLVNTEIHCLPDILWLCERDPF